MSKLNIKTTLYIGIMGFVIRSQELMIVIMLGIFSAEKGFDKVESSVVKKPNNFRDRNSASSLLYVLLTLHKPHLSHSQARSSSFNPFPKTNFRLFQTERLCRRQFHFDESGNKFSKRIENTVGKGEIARYEQFLLFPQCFQKTYTADI